MGLFGSLGKLVGKGLKLAGGVLPGGAAAQSVAGGVVGKLLKRHARKVVAVAAAGGATAITYAKKHPRQALMAGAGAVAGTAAIMAQHGGGNGRSYRRMNPGNTRAMRRAIRRVEQGARLYSKLFSFRKGHVKGAPGVHVKKMSIRRSS